MKKTKTIISVIAALLAIVLPFLSVVTVVLAIPPQYSDSFTGALNEKYDRLHSIKEDKIVVVGGSSVAFGLDSEALERYTGMPVVNFGLYAALGTKLMLDLSDSGIKKGDIVVIAPELDPQTLSMYFNSRTTLEAIDDDYRMMLDIGFDSWFNLFGGMWSFAGRKLALYNSDDPQILDPVYNAANLNEYGDVCLERPENVMAKYRDTNKPVDLSVDMLGDGFDEFCDYLNKYIAKLKLKGAEVYFSFCPINEMSLSDNTTEQTRAELVDYLKENINCEFISELDDYILEAGYFFDTNFHLNDAGADVRTARLARDLRNASERVDVTAIIKAEPAAPALPEAEIRYVGADDPNAKYFTYSVITDEGSYKGAYVLTGLTELGRQQKTLTLPLGADGLKVVFVGASAFADCSATTLILPKGTNIMLFENGAFLDSGFTEMYMYDSNFPYIAPPADFYGVDAGFVVHIPRGMNESGLYEWSQRGLYFIYDLDA